MENPPIDYSWRCKPQYRAGIPAAGGKAIDYSSSLDGPMAQGITIDVAYRYINRAGRSFIASYYEEYTRNMAVGATLQIRQLVLRMTQE